MPVRTSRDKQQDWDRQRVRWTNSDCLACLSHLYIGDRYRQGVRVKTPEGRLRVRTRTSNAVDLEQEAAHLDETEAA